MGRLLLLGDPVSHSLSPVFQNAALRACALSSTYEVRQTTAAELPSVIAQIASGHVLGANVTLPLKVQAAGLVDRLEGSASVVGAVNTIVRQADGILVGHNTDVAGLKTAISERWSTPFRSALVLGAGGASAAAVACLASLGVRSLLIANRDAGRAQTLAQRFCGEMSVVGAGLEETLARTDLSPDLVIHGTSLSVGAPPQSAAFREAMELWTRARWLSEASAAVDLSYARHGTAFLEVCRGASVPAIDGLTMLLHQGALSFELWTGCQAPLDVMRSALHAATGR